MPEQKMKAMILAAGLGTRLKPFTDHHPKALVIVKGKTLLQRNIEYLRSYGINDIIVNIHHFPDQIVHYLEANNNFGCNISISHEVDAPLETGGGLKKASWFFDNEQDPFIVMNVDILTNLDINSMKVFHYLHKPLATLAVTKRDTSRNFLFDAKQVLCGWINTRTGESRISKQGHEPLQAYAFTCVHLIEPRMLSLISQVGKFSIIDTYLDLAKTHTILSYPHSNDIVVDVGKPESLQEAEKHFNF